MPWLLVGLLPGAVWAWLTHRRMLSVVLGVSVAIVLGTHVPRLWHPDATAPPSAVTLHVMSYNTWSGNRDARRIAGVIRSQAPDLLLLQEILPEVFDDVMDLLPDLYDGSPVHCAYDPTIRQAVVSRHPVEPRASMPEKGQAQEVVLRSPGGPITVFNVHPLRHGGWRQRYGQMASLLEEHVLGEKGPVILAGDFNASDHSQLYGLIAGHLGNAHREVGVGFGFTYPASGYRVLGVSGRPVARIDHVFYSEHFVAVRAGTLADSGGSDHRAVFAELALKPAAPRDGGGPAGPAAPGIPAREPPRDRGGQGRAPTGSPRCRGSILRVRCSKFVAVTIWRYARGVRRTRRSALRRRDHRVGEAASRSHIGVVRQGGAQRTDLGCVGPASQCPASRGGRSCTLLTTRCGTGRCLSSGPIPRHRSLLTRVAYGIPARGQ